MVMVFFIVFSVGGLVIKECSASLSCLLACVSLFESLGRWAKSNQPLPVLFGLRSVSGNYCARSVIGNP